MNTYAIIKKSLFFLLYISIFLAAHLNGYEKFDVMVDFAYPLSVLESVRYALTQAVFYLQHKQENLAISFLEQALSSLNIQQKMTDDDYAFLENMLDQINFSIDGLENDQHKLILVQLSQEISSKL